MMEAVRTVPNSKFVLPFEAVAEREIWEGQMKNRFKEEIKG
jgi:hypothetical protein